MRKFARGLLTMANKPNFAQIKAIEEKNKRRFLALNPSLTEQSGIYILYREENGIKFAYVGQAIHLIDRLVSHLMGYDQHIDKSLKKHKLYSKDNQTGWQIKFFNCTVDKLNILEQQTILDYATAGFQMLNKTSGSQGAGKFGITENKSHKSYRDGVKYGKIATLRQIKKYFDIYIEAVIKEPTSKIKQRKLQEFMELLNGEYKEKD